MKKNIKHFILSIVLLILFVLFTILLKVVDVGGIGPQGSKVGFATLNECVRNFIGCNMTLYNITDWASILAILIILGFALLGLCQLIKRKSLLKVDSSILVLGGFYITVFGAYMFFESFVINYRPVLIDSILEASYPSSTTMLIMCIMPTAIMQFNLLIKTNSVKYIVNTVCGIYTVLMLTGRILSGVHWITDIIGGVLLSTALTMLYFSINKLIEK